MIPAKLYSSSVTQFPPCNSSCILLICIVKIKTSYAFKMKASRCRGGKKVNSDSLRAGVQSKVLNSFLLTVQDFNRLSPTNMYFFASGVKKKTLHKCLFLHHF